MNARPMLEQRSRVRRALRQLFDGLGFLEVDTPVLSTEVLPEAHIDPIEVAATDTGVGPRYLQASPEALMKRLLAAGSGPIYQFARAFRAGERGRQHDVEFVLLEWYAPGARLAETADLLDRVCHVTLGTRGIERVSCSTAFAAHAGVDPRTASLPAMRAALTRAGLALPESTAAVPDAEQWDRAFELLLAEVVQPRLGRDRPTMLEAWPASQAAFGQIDASDPATALRFELFVNGVELANGWEEETSRDVLTERIAAANLVRSAAGRRPLPIPRWLLAAHGDGMPEGVGAALGFDRLVMLAAGAESIDAVRWFNSSNS